MIIYEIPFVSNLEHSLRFFRAQSLILCIPALLDRYIVSNKTSVVGRSQAERKNELFRLSAVSGAIVGLEALGCNGFPSHDSTRQRGLLPGPSDLLMDQGPSHSGLLAREHLRGQEVRPASCED